MSNYTFYAEHPVGKFRKSDNLFIVCTILLWGLGIYTLFSCTQNIGERFFGTKYYFLSRQIVSSVIGLCGFLFFALAPVRFIRRFIFSAAVVSLFLCFMALLPGVGLHKNGASRWIALPFLGTFQPSEIVKFTIVLYLSNMIDRHMDEYEESKGEFIYPVLVLVLFTLVIAFQRDLSTGVFVFLIGFVVFFISGARLRWMIPLALLAIPAAAIFILIEPYRIERIIAFLRPAEHAFDSGFQAMKSKGAISAGGIWGVGGGEVLDVIAGIPEVQTDYIFSGWAASMGLVGVTAYFVLLSAFAWRGFKIAVNCPDRFAGTAAFVFTFAVLIQSLLNCAVVSGAVPTTGVPLPFFSSGGSSLIVTFCMCGFILNASHCSDDIYKSEKKENENSKESYLGVVVEYE